MSIQKKFSNLKRYTVEEFQEDFDNLMNLIENDKKSFVITSKYDEVVIMPAEDEIVRIYTEHNEAS